MDLIINLIVLLIYISAIIIDITLLIKLFRCCNRVKKIEQDNESIKMQLLEIYKRQNKIIALLEQKSMEDI